MSHLSDRRLLGLCGAALVTSLITSCSEEAAKVAPPPPDVEVATVRQRDVPIYHDWVCTLSASVNATISAQVTGYLIAQKYREGAIVKAGQALLQIEPSSFQAALLKAQAHVEEAQACESKNEQDVQRYTPLAASQAISKQELDDAIQAEKASKAQVDGAKDALLIPSKSVAEMQGRNLIAIVDLDNKVSIQLVTVGEHYGSESVTVGDIKAGDRSWSRACRRLGRGWWSLPSRRRRPRPQPWTRSRRPPTRCLLMINPRPPTRPETRSRNDGYPSGFGHDPV